MHIWTNSIRFVCSHYCKLTSVKSFLSHDHCATVTWPLRHRRMTITVRTKPAKMAILSISFNFASLRWVDPGHSRSPIRSQEPWFGRLSNQPSLSHWISVCTHEHSLIYRRTSNVYIAWLQVRIHFDLDRNHLLKWIGSKPVWIRFGPIHFWCELDKCALNRTECASRVQCEQAFRNTN